MQPLPAPPVSSEYSSTLSSATFLDGTDIGGRESDSDSDRDGHTIWVKKPSKSANSLPLGQASHSSNRPPLAPLSIESSPSSGPHPLPTNASQDYGRSPPLPDYIPTSVPPRTPRRTGAITQSSKKHKDWISMFDNNYDGN